MRPAEYTREQIIEAGLALREAARNVTGFALRQRLGGGNPNRLKQVWDEHVAAQAATPAQPVAELPVEVAEQVATVTAGLTARLAALATDLNDRAVKAAERRVAEVVRAAGEQREQAERELADAATTVDDLEGRLEAAKAGGEALEQRLADTQAERQALAVELAQLRGRLAAAAEQARRRRNSTPRSWPRRARKPRGCGRNSTTAGVRRRRSWKPRARSLRRRVPRRRPPRRRTRSSAGWRPRRRTGRRNGSRRCRPGATPRAGKRPGSARRPPGRPAGSRRLPPRTRNCWPRCVTGLLARRRLTARDRDSPRVLRQILVRNKKSTVASAFWVLPQS
ncbi:DNA-binding protein [Paraburkholderia kururiensis]|uniref:DNA-binding protein n=1 Tax=Paraburkholderia kururiensis TaxID=984307 RepID=UPI00196B2CA3|nr:DNA-binding protein [Paraburkholderia kururiensis]